MKKGIYYSIKSIKHIAVELDERFIGMVEDHIYWEDLIGTYQGAWNKQGRRWL